MREKISAISLISYDADRLLTSIPSYYNFVDEIILGLDEDRISWSKNKFSFDESMFFNKIQNIDGDNKIKIIEHNFHKTQAPILNDTHERNFLKYYTTNDFSVSFDADEILVNAQSFFNKFLPIAMPYKDVQFLFTWFLPYKTIGDTTLFIAEENGKDLFIQDVQGFTSRKNDTFTYCRWNNTKRKILSPLSILHYSFCRSDSENNDKVSNYGHSIESRQDPFYDIQKQVTLENYTSLYNFKTHGAGHQWPRLVAIKNEDISAYCKEQAEKVYK